VLRVRHPMSGRVEIVDLTDKVVDGQSVPGFYLVIDAQRAPVAAVEYRQRQADLARWTHGPSATCQPCALRDRSGASQMSRVVVAEARRRELGVLRTSMGGM